MELVDKFIISPSVNQLSLSTYIVLLSLLIQLPYLGLLSGFSCLSVFFRAVGINEDNHAYIRFSKLLTGTIVFNRYVVFLFGVLPLFSLYLSLSQYLISSNVRLSYFFALLLPTMLAGCVLALAYQHLLRTKPESLLQPLLVGLGGAGLLLFSSYFLLSIISFVINFERRFFTQDLSLLLLSWNGIACYLLFLALTLALTGSAALALGSGQLKVDDSALSDEMAEFSKEVGTVAVYISIAIAPVAAVAYFFTLPSVAVSPSVIVSTLALLVMLALSFFVLQKAGNRSGALVAPVLFATLLISFSVSTLGDVLSMENSTREHAKRLIAEAEASRAKLAAKATHSEGAKSADMEKLGERIFNDRCSACHKYDSRLVGPPYDQVLPKYKDNMDELISFILSPTKKDPGYPPMPNPGLSRNEAEAVAQYVLQRLEHKKNM